MGLKLYIEGRPQNDVCRFMYIHDPTNLGTILNFYPNRQKLVMAYIIYQDFRKMSIV